MIKAQIELPEDLYAKAQSVARDRDISLEEVVRRGLEYITGVYAPAATKPSGWSLPPPSDLGECRVRVDQWRITANDPAAGKHQRLSRTWLCQAMESAGVKWL